MMESDYAYASKAQGYPCAPVVPHFEGLPQLAERAEMADDRIQRFIDRFHGTPPTGAAGAQLAPAAAGHIGQLQRVCRAIERLEQLASELDSIG